MEPRERLIASIVRLLTDADETRLKIIYFFVLHLTK